MSKVKELIKPRLQQTGVWPLLKYLLPKYRRPLTRLGTARLKAIVGGSAAHRKELSRAYAELAKVHLASDYLPEAIASCDKAIGCDPGCADAFIHRADALLRQGRRAEAAKGFGGILSLKYNDARVHIALADALLRLADPLEALRHYDRARALDISVRWPSGAALTTGDPFLTGKALLDYYNDQTSAEKELALLKGAAPLLEEAARGRESLDRLEQLQRCYLLMGRTADFIRALQRYFAARESQPDFQKHQAQGPKTDYLPDVCARGIGCMGYLVTYAKKKILLGKPERLVLCAPPGEVVNPAFLSYFKPHIDVLESHAEIAAVAQAKAACDLPFGLAQRFDGPVNFLMSVMAQTANRWAQEGRAPLLSLRASDRARGEAQLAKIGLRPGDWWVCLHVRTPTYYKETARSPDGYRNADITTYFDAIKLVAERGGWVFRMGDPSMGALPKMDRVVDYATSDLRSDWMDVFLCSQNRFYIGTNSGLLLVPNGFGAPSVATNNLPLLMTPFLPDDIFLPKLLRRTDGSFVPFREMLREPLLGAVTQGIYDWSGVKIVNNTSAELRGAIAEMLESFDGQGRRRVPALSEHQKKFNALVEEAGIQISGRVSADFLRRHTDLL